MKKNSLFFATISFAQTAVRERLCFDNGWRFYQGDIAMLDSIYTTCGFIETEKGRRRDWAVV